MNPQASDAVTGQTAALLTAPDSNDVNDASDINVMGATRRSMDETAPAAGRERIHQFAGMLHQAIDKVEQTFTGNRGNRGKAGTVLEQARTRPLRSAGIALGGFMVLRKVLGRSSTPRDVHVEVVQVPVPSRSVREYTRPFIERRASYASGWFKGAGQQVRQATNGLMSKGQQYGAMASAGVRTYPMAGLGAVTAAAAILTTVLLRRRAASGYDYDTADGGLDTMDLQRTTQERSGAAELVASRPLASAAVLLGVGALLGVLMRRP